MVLLFSSRLVFSNFSSPDDVNDEYKKKYTRPMIAATPRTRYHIFCFCVSRKKASMNIAIKIPVVEVETSIEAATRKAKSICLSLSRKKRGTNMKEAYD